MATFQSFIITQRLRLELCINDRAGIQCIFRASLQFKLGTRLRGYDEQTARIDARTSIAKLPSVHDTDRLIREATPFREPKH